MSRGTGLQAVSLLVFIASTVLGATYDEELLKRDLLRQYDPTVHPERVKLTFNVVFDGCPVLNVQNGRLSSHLFMSHSWRDSRLVWMPDDYADIGSIRLNPTEIWTPGIKLTNGKSMDESGPETGDKATVHSNGAIHWTRVEEFASDCERVLTEGGSGGGAVSWKCQLNFVSWKYAGDEFRLVSPDYQQDIVDNRCPGMRAESSIEKVGLGSSAFYSYNVVLTVNPLRINRRHFG